MSKAWREKDFSRALWTAAQCRAKKHGVVFTIPKSAVVIPEFCPILGIRLGRKGGVACDTSPTLDRIRPALGYVPGNVAVISMRANRIKNDGTPEEHEAIARFMRAQE